MAIATAVTAMQQVERAIARVIIKNKASRNEGIVVPKEEWQHVRVITAQDVKVYLHGFKIST